MKPLQIIFEMETAAVAQTVYKRFQKFPCIVQNNPLSFSMKPDGMLVGVTFLHPEISSLRKEIFVGRNISSVPTVVVTDTFHLF